MTAEMERLREAIARAVGGIHEADVILDAIEAEGAKVVFREPTPEMLKAGWDTGTTKAPNIAYNVWTPMFDAAPSLTEPRKVERGPAGATYGSYDYEEKP
jgi:hypothetical protein